VRTSCVTPGPWPFHFIGAVAGDRIRVNDQFYSVTGREHSNLLTGDVTLHLVPEAPL
jgi:hypothetical protein